MYKRQKQLLDTIDIEPVIFEQEYFPEDVLITENLPYTVARDEDDEHVFIIEGPKIEKMCIRDRQNILIWKLICRFQEKKQ